MQLLQYGYKQRNDWGCGPAVANVLLHSYDIKMSTSDLVKELKTTRGGTNDGDLLRFLKKRGIKFKSKKGANLKKLAGYLKNYWVVVTYWIPRTKENHYSIVTRISTKRIYFHDTWYGASHSYSLDYFLKNWQEAGSWLLAVKK